ncbi:28S ribosomal protein S28, mitochondrial [Hylaeus anthracinus]|uniref:28S ribosomal protein S28, mitochondrial n=1 Tax=Hylaeus anthracinus TaxID=313031 RepID=UPI0023B95299|nr:28S ribosomal protein S28, mitochondrial [Hylaeus anthracinus]
MDKIRHYGKLVKQLRFVYEFRTSSILTRNYTTENSSNENVTNTERQNVDTKQARLGGFAKAFIKFSALSEKNDILPQPPRLFVSMLRHSKFMNLGDPEGQIVKGQIFNVIGNDLYIDFGWKFHCVCPKPKMNSDKFIRGAEVILKIKELELSTRFLGATKDLTILEADCVLLNYLAPPPRKA